MTFADGWPERPPSRICEGRRRFGGRAPSRQNAPRSSDVRTEPPKTEGEMPRFAYFCGHEQFQPERFLEHAVQAEAVGFDADRLRPP
jgi:hypothetical protein